MCSKHLNFYRLQYFSTIQVETIKLKWWFVWVFYTKFLRLKVTLKTELNLALTKGNSMKICTTILVEHNFDWISFA